MGTIAGINKKFIEEVKVIINLLPADNADRETLLKSGEEGVGADLFAAIAEADKQRLNLIEKYSYEPPSDDVLKQQGEALKARTLEMIKTLKIFHARQLHSMNDPKFRDKLEIAQNNQIAAIEAMQKEDEDNWSQLSQKEHSKRMSAAMIDQHLFKDPNIGAVEKFTTWFKGGTTLEKRSGWSSLWYSVEGAIMTRSETARKWFDKTEGTYDDNSGVAHEFARKFAQPGWTYGPEKEGSTKMVWLYKKPEQGDQTDDEIDEAVPQLMIEAAEGLASAAGSSDTRTPPWGFLPSAKVKNYYENEPTHEYLDLISAGAYYLVPSGSSMNPVYGGAVMAIWAFNAIFAPDTGKFIIKYTSLPADKRFPSAMGLSAEGASGILGDAQNIVRVGVMLREWMARGMETVELRRMPPELQEESYLAARRAGFPHDKIFLNGQLFSAKLKEIGDGQKAVIDQGLKQKKPVEELTRIALNIPHLDSRLSVTEFFTHYKDPVQTNDMKKLFNDPLTTTTQRAAILANPASIDMHQEIFAHLGEDTYLDLVQGTHLLGALAALDQTRALQDFLHIAPAPKQLAVFKDLASRDNMNAGFLARILMSEPDNDRRQALFDSIETPGNKAELLSKLSTKTITKLYQDSADQSTLFDEMVAWTLKNKIAGSSLLGSLAVGIYNKVSPENTMDFFNKISEQLPFLERGVLTSACKAAFINHPALSFDDRKSFMASLDKGDLNYLEYREFLSLMTAENAYFYLQDKYAAKFEDELSSTFSIPFVGLGVDSDRVEQFRQFFAITEGHRPGDGVPGAQPPLPDRYANGGVDFSAAYLIPENAGADTQRDTILAMNNVSVAANILKKLSNETIDSVKAQIPGNAKAAEIFYDMEPEQASEFLARSSADDRMNQLKGLASNADTYGKKLKYFQILKFLGSTITEDAIVKSGNNSAIIDFLSDMVTHQVIGKSQEDTTFLAKLLTGIAAKGIRLTTPPGQQNPVVERIPLTSDMRAKILAGVDDPVVIKALIASEIVQDAALAVVINKMTDAKQRVKVFAQIVRADNGQPDLVRQKAVFDALDDKSKDAVFRSAPEQLQKEYIEGLAGGAIDANIANQIVRLTSRALANGHKDDLFHLVPANKQAAVLKAATHPSIEFLVARLQGGSAIADLMNITKFGTLEPGQNITAAVAAENRSSVFAYFKKIAQAGLLLPNEGGPEEFFKNGLRLEGNAKFVRTEMLEMLVERKHHNIAKDFFDSLTQLEKDEVKSRVEGKFNQFNNPLSNPMRAAVGLDPLSPPAPATEDSPQQGPQN